MNFRIILISIIVIRVKSEIPLEKNDNEYYFVRYPENFFASRLFEVLANSTPSNFITSPLSVHVALATLAIGTRGKTLDELRLLLLDLPDTNQLNDYEVTTTEVAKQDNFHLMNQLFIDKNFKILPEYKAVVKLYRSGIKSINLTNSRKATYQINDWCEKYTNGRFKNFLSEREVANSKLIIANAVYFKGNWVHKFRHSRTYPQTFYLNLNTKKTVLAMHQRNVFNCGKLPEVHAKYIKLPYISRYSHQKLNMYIIVPDKYDLTTVEQNFDSINFFELNASTKLNKVDLSLPKFKIESYFDLKKTLHQLEIKNIFNKDADFSGISNNSSLYTTKVIQKSYIEINEDGSDAESTSGIINNESDEVRNVFRNVRFTVDRPFIVVITTNEFIVFVGRVTDPTLSFKNI